MDARNVTTVEQAREIIEQRNIEHVKVGVFDIDGILRGKYISKEKFFSALSSGFGFCDVVLGWDVQDKPYDNIEFTGWHTGYPDAEVKIIPNSCRELPLENNTLFFLAEFTGKAEDICPRSILKRVLKKADEMGIHAFAGFEYEFFVFNESSKSIREKKYNNLDYLTESNFGYSVIRNSVESETYEDLLILAKEMDFGIEGLHEETGPGVMEAALTYDSAINAADKAALFKTFSKIALQKKNKVATFMAKWSEDYPGQSGHIHVSLKDKNNDSLFFDNDNQNNMSLLMQNFVAGQQKLMPEFLAMIAPTINSYKRLVPGSWAPTEASVGVDNRTCALRIIKGSEKSQRVEYRIAAADANPYLVLAAVIASGLWGVENKAEIQDMVVGNAYDKKFPDDLLLPRTLWDAAQSFKASSIA